MIDRDLYAKAVHHVTFDRKASTSYIQRRLQIGYNTAAAIMEEMEKNGVVGPCNHVGKRDILVGPPDVNAEPAPAAATPAPEAEPVPALKPKPAYAGPVQRFTCSGCDATADGPADALPDSWHWQTTARLGEVPRCHDCAIKNASRIATGRMSTEEILNAGADGAPVDPVNAAAQGELRSFIERLERLFEDMATIQGDAKEVKGEAKGRGYDVKIIMMVIRARRKDKIKRQEEQDLFDLYMSAIGEV